MWRRKPRRVDEFPRTRRETEKRRDGLCFNNDGITGGMRSKGVLETGLRLRVVSDGDRWLRAVDNRGVENERSNGWTNASSQFWVLFLSLSVSAARPARGSWMLNIESSSEGAARKASSMSDICKYVSQLVSLAMKLQRSS